ncbi:hypothetical protein BYT27DRAFT_7341295 [Phlegmacium glaucopus]|nr:hypothetical protein BYT27DRAFT_7341295 [Phlegmacium glaucopus]
MNPLLDSSKGPKTLPNPFTEPEAPDPECERDNLYYFDIIVFKVDNTLFRVPKNGFQVADSFFETIFSLPQPEGTMVEGSDDTCPLILSGISKAYFRGFLRVLYPFNGTAVTYEEWVGALDLATMWDFKEIRRASVGVLSKLINSRNAVENILLAKKYRVKQWLRDGYLKLLQQTEPLNIDELRASNVDLLTIARLWSIYGTIMANRSKAPSNCSNCSGCDSGGSASLSEVTHAEADPLILKIFADEFKEMKDGLGTPKKTNGKKKKSSK